MVLCSCVISGDPAWMFKYWLIMTISWQLNVYPRSNLFWNKEKIPPSSWWWFLWLLTSVSYHEYRQRGMVLIKRLAPNYERSCFILISCLWARRQPAWPAWSVEHTRNGWRGATAVSTRQQQQQQHAALVLCLICKPYWEDLLWTSILVFDSLMKESWERAKRDSWETVVKTAWRSEQELQRFS